MTRLIRYIRKAKLNKNKKGFTLVELLVAVTVLAILTPVVVQGFIYASKLNYRSRLQQRADAAANTVYEGIASVKYEELENYLSELNGWTPVNDGTGEGYEYYVEKYYDELEDCQIKVAVQEYSEAYIVPDLNFVGVESKYLTLASEINSLDSIAGSKIEQAIKSDEEIKNAIAQDILVKIRETYGVIIDRSEIAISKILIDCGTIDSEKVSKQTKINLGVANGEFFADYELSYRYPASTPNPTYDNESLYVSYSYAHQINGQWKMVSGTNVDVCQLLKSYYNNPNYKYQFVMQAEAGRKTIAAEVDENDLISNQSMFVYYDPFSKMDWVEITSGATTGWDYSVFFIEQSEDGNTLALDNTDASVNNFKYSDVTKPTNDYTLLIHGTTSTKLYSNNRTIASSGIPDSIYESKENKAKMYRVQVYVTYKSTVFADVSGSFEAGGDTVDKYTG